MAAEPTPREMDDQIAALTCDVAEPRPNHAARRLAAHAMHQRTAAPVAECARWLEEAGGDAERAVEMMRAGDR